MLAHIERRSDEVTNSPKDVEKRHEKGGKETKNGENVFEKFPIGCGKIGQAFHIEWVKIVAKF